MTGLRDYGSYFQSLFFCSFGSQFERLEVFVAEIDALQARFHIIAYGYKLVDSFHFVASHEVIQKVETLFNFVKPFRVAGQLTVVFGKCF